VVLRASFGNFFPILIHIIELEIDLVKGQAAQGVPLARILHPGLANHSLTVALCPEHFF